MREVCNQEWDDIQVRLREKDAEIAQLHMLLRRAADALEEFAAYISGDPDAYRYLRLKEQQLIAELRKAAQ
jgi:hypothetical protein